MLPECCICSTTFASSNPHDEHAPIQSSKCSHSFCRSCVLNSHLGSAQRRRRISCLVCRAEKAFHVQDLHVNLELMHLMENMRLLQCPAPVLSRIKKKRIPTMSELVHGLTMGRTYHGTLHPLPESGHLFHTVQREVEISFHYPSLQRDISWRLKVMLWIDKHIHGGIIPSIVLRAQDLVRLRRDLRVAWKAGCPLPESALHGVYNASAFVEAFLLEPGAKDKLAKWDLEPPERRWGRTPVL